MRFYSGCLNSPSWLAISMNGLFDASHESLGNFFCAVERATTVRMRLGPGPETVSSNLPPNITARGEAIFILPVTEFFFFAGPWCHTRAPLSSPWLPGTSPAFHRFRSKFGLQSNQENLVSTSAGDHRDHHLGVDKERMHRVPVTVFGVRDVYANWRHPSVWPNDLIRRKVGVLDGVHELVR